MTRIRWALLGVATLLPGCVDLSAPWASRMDSSALDGPAVPSDSRPLFDEGGEDLGGSVQDGPGTPGPEAGAVDTKGDTAPERDAGTPDTQRLDTLAVDTRVDLARDLARDQVPPPDSGVDVPRDTALPDTPIEVPAQGALVYYPAESANGNSLPDESGNGRNGVLAGDFRIVAGKTGRGLALTATAASGSTGPTGGYVTLPTNLLATSKEMTIATWIRLNNTQPWQRIFEIGSSTSNAMFLTPFTDATAPLMRFSIEVQGGTKQTLEAPTLPLGAWKHVAVVLDKVGCRLYVDGVVQSLSTTITLRPVDLGTTTNNWIGKSSFDNRSDPTKNDPYLDGRIDEFRVYDRALSEEEIAYLFTR